MSKPPYPLHPEPMKKSWIEGHPQWKIPLGLLLLIVLIVGFSATMGTIMLATYRHSDVYKQAVARASESAPVRELIGEPITPGWAVSGALHINGRSGDADLSIPISGPRGTGAIRAIASKGGGVWRFSYLQVNVSGRNNRIDLLSDELSDPNSGHQTVTQ